MTVDPRLRYVVGSLTAEEHFEAPSVNTTTTAVKELVEFDNGLFDSFRSQNLFDGYRRPQYGEEGPDCFIFICAPQARKFANSFVRRRN